ncbi:uncharacterized protein BXZ73DRAFT_38135 [Epithele typhae]|uniref:uncharacterized protein n=1 Tax=Epithele typhae TaxID=378194 RepID=UPI00200876CE|nr:uncharacterized protein BXZ73DRAFT_38135 [Epithele typhae]KAH9944954.1 hypothetical protein BXZ73DRAFT_38135 [Epithele typhae]
MFFNWGLQGCLVVQCYIYHLWFPHDRLYIKSLVYGLLIYECVQTGLVTDFAFDNFVYGYGQRAILTQFHNTWFSVTIMCSLVSCVVQSYFAYRVWVLGRSAILTGIILFLSFAQMSVGVAGGIMLHVIDPNAAAASIVTPVISSWLGGAALADVIIAASMSYLLLRGKNGIKRSDDMINALVRFVVETGAMTATVAVLDLICFTALSNTLLHECPALVLAKLYSNTLVASLNNRVIITRSQNGPILTTSTPSGQYQLRNLSGSRTFVTAMGKQSGKSGIQSQGQIEVGVDVDVQDDTSTVGPRGSALKHSGSKVDFKVPPIDVLVDDSQRMQV